MKELGDYSGVSRHSLLERQVLVVPFIFLSDRLKASNLITLSDSACVSGSRTVRLLVAWTSGLLNHGAFVNN